MNKRLLLPCLGLLCSLGSFAYEKGDYVFTATERLKVTGETNLITNGDFSVQSTGDAGFGWRDATGANVSTDYWLPTATEGYDGKGGLISQSVDAAATLYQAVPFTAAQKLVVSFKIKANDSFSSTVTSGSTNYIDVYANADGSVNKSAERFQQVASSVVVGSEWTDVAYCFADTVSGGSNGYVVISLGRLPEGTIVSDFEVKEVTQVFDTRIADRAFAYTDYLLENSGYFPEGLEDFKGYYDEIKEGIYSPDYESISDAESLLESLNDAQEEWLDENSTELITYCSKYDITTVSAASKGLKNTGDWYFNPSGDRWAHSSGSAYFSSSIPGNYAFPAQTCMIKKSAGAPFTAGEKFLFRMDGRGCHYFKTKVDNSYYTIDYSKVVESVKMFVNNDTTTWTSVSPRAYSTYGAIGTLPADSSQLVVGIQFADFGDHGGWVSCGKPSLRIIGYSESAIKRAAYISDVFVQQEALKARLDDAAERIADPQRPWGNQPLQDSVDVYAPLYQASLAYVDTLGNDLKNPEMPESGYDDTLLAAVRAMNTARNNFSNINKPFTDIVASIETANSTKTMRIYDGSTKRAELEAAIAAAQTMHDSKLNTEFNSEDSLALATVNTELLAAIEAFKAAVPETVIVDIDFGTQENPTAIKSRVEKTTTEGSDEESSDDEGTTVYYIEGAKGEMILADSTAFELGYENADSLGMLRIGNSTGTVNFSGAPAKATDIVKVSFDYYFGNLLGKSAGWYIKDAGGNDIAGLFFSKYSGTNTINTFGVDYNGKISGVGSSSAGNAAIAAKSNCTHFDVVLDYGKGKMYCSTTNSSRGNATTEEVDLDATQIPAQFIIKTDYTGADARNCWFDNLKISNIAAGEYSGISNVAKEKNSVKNDVKYNLAGQRIVTPSKGQIYIMNGKKYIAK